MVTTVFNPVCHSGMAKPHPPPKTTLHLSSSDKLRSWLSDDSNDPTTILSLHLTGQRGPHNWLQNNHSFLKISSFLKVKSLTLVDPDLTSSDNISYATFKGFGPKLTSLSVESATNVSAGALSRLIERFSVLENLTIHNISPGPQIPKITSQFRGKLTLSGISEVSDPPSFWKTMEIAEMRLDNYRFHSQERMEELFRACEKTLKKVELSNVSISISGDPRGSFHWRSRVFVEISHF